MVFTMATGPALVKVDFFWQKVLASAVLGKVEDVVDTVIFCLLLCSNFNAGCAGGADGWGSACSGQQ